MLNEEQAREELTDILNGREYKAYEEKPNTIFEQWWEDLKAWFNEFLNNIFPDIEITKDHSGSVLFFVVVVTIVLLLLLVTLLVRKRNRNRAIHKNMPLQSIDELKWTYEMHLAEANKLEATNKYKKATRHMFLALLLYFHEKEWLIARIWKTNWEYYDELKQVKGNWAQQFYELALLFDEATYGEKVVKEQEYRTYKKNVLKLIQDGQDLEKNKQ
ncbi:DUF4129 domain-containing protein [Metabacillus malikii]|uniref:DUF4129 domain-containing protein n=1 Tax=Metabacillus malikii TaxID=1504265 RepID=A0ABT9ZFT2_9BACI|nr:DUF4129 domain-containing protein [Metabacillus malikii]MDQ0231144.1 hypothetical protein [Metabacillus malikii]